jgi:uncharacterized repeat protein (TIGR02059 family)
VSGRVRLTLSSAVAYGDNVTVAYTKPSTNPLQTSAGGQAAFLGAQAVINRVAALPVYISSVVEDASPTIIEMTYSLSLANVVPSTSAFRVMVNSSTRTVLSVSIVSGKVRLTLSNPIVYGDNVTVSYTKPSSNSLQTSSGGEAVSLYSRPVTNNCTEPIKLNTPPALMIKEIGVIYSGFVYEIDASETTDPDDDPLVFEWSIPYPASASADSGSTIRFLAPVINSPQTIEFQMRVNDGKSEQIKSIPVTVNPYRPELSVARIIAIDASSYQTPDYPENIIDGNITTKWAAEGDYQSLIFTLAEPFMINHLEIAFFQGQKCESYFDVYASKDNLSWNPILIRAVSCDFSGERQVFDFPDSDTEVEYSYLKLVGRTNSLNTWNYFSEIKIYGTYSENAFSVNPGITIYPNPANDYFNISVEGNVLNPEIITLTDLSGRTLLTDIMNQGITNVPIPAHFKSGVYIVRFISGDIILWTQKIVIIR